LKRDNIDAFVIFLRDLHVNNAENMSLHFTQLLTYDLSTTHR